MITLQWIEADTEASCLRLINSKEGASISSIGLPVVEYLEGRWAEGVGTYVFPGQGEDNVFGSFPNHRGTIDKLEVYQQIVRDTVRPDMPDVNILADGRAALPLARTAPRGGCG